MSPASVPRSKVLSVLCGLFLLFSIPFVLCAGCGYYGLKVVYLDDANEVERLKADFAANVPAGSTHWQAEAWLKAQGLTEVQRRGRYWIKPARIGEIRVHVKYDARGLVRGVAVEHEPAPLIGGGRVTPVSDTLGPRGSV